MKDDNSNTNKSSNLDINNTNESLNRDNVNINESSNRDNVNINESSNRDNVNTNEFSNRDDNKKSFSDLKEVYAHLSAGESSESIAFLLVTGFIRQLLAISALLLIFMSLPLLLTIMSDAMYMTTKKLVDYGSQTINEDVGTILKSSNTSAKTKDDAFDSIEMKGDLINSTVIQGDVTESIVVNNSGDNATIVINSEGVITERLLYLYDTLTIKEKEVVEHVATTIQKQEGSMEFKGVLSESTLNYLKEAGYTCIEYKVSGRTLYTIYKETY